MKIDLPDECFRKERRGGGRGGVIERGMGSIPSRPRTNFLEETWGVWGRGFIVKHEVESFARDKEEAFQLRGNAVSKGTCVDRILDRLVSNIGNEEENEQSPPLSYACKSIFPSSSMRPSFVLDAGVR